MTALELFRMRLAEDRDVFVLRRLGRAAAELAGLEAQDQIRIATALSEVGREVIGSGALVRSTLEDGELIITIEHAADADPAGSDGVALARRLVDRVTADDGRFTLVKRLPGRKPSMPAARIREQLARVAPTTALEELRQQNRELAATLDDVLRLNAELQETNAGVLALYNELSTELEETNRGVVALYAELDEKSSQLREVAETRNRFWATVSHELRTPLNSIIGLVRLLTGPGGEPLSGEQEQQIGFIGSSAETLLALVGELLDMAKAESGPLHPQLGSVNLVRLVHQLRATMQPTSDVALHTEVAPEVGEIYTDEGMLTRVLRNLVANALKYTQEGEVRLSAHLDEEAGQVVITVSDTGIGISEEHLSRVFEEFFQVPNALQVKTKGTGLGLPYARRLAEALDGQLELTSAPGSGTTATLRLPRRHGPPEIGRLLIADDDQGFRELARRMLYGVASEIEEAADGIEALELMTARPPDVLVLDMLMPRLDGNALLQRMSEDENLGEVSVVVVTVAPGKAAEGHPVLSKQGMRRHDLLEAVREAARGRGA
ncbi:MULTISPECIES: ATP-binding protein [Nonomuraea]|uniref:histidine kinase n=1 Tax=Nonomuraea ferruginea TaxID=46174 RepID=A0ABT4T9G7_9ACTN|nr:ATP-binding protein [Nonomuraea ferruginea]MDA0646153.1 ATP-binding protein [Nonomuraea ferruginea]